MSLQTVDGDKGRVETRSYTQCDVIEWLQKRHPQWEALSSIGRVASPLPTDIAHFAHAVRSHWGIENRLHWVLDVTFQEDYGWVRKDHAPANFAVIKHNAVNLLN